MFPLKFIKNIVVFILLGLSTYTSLGESLTGYRLYLCILAKQDRQKNSTQSDQNHSDQNQSDQNKNDQNQSDQN